MKGMRPLTRAEVCQIEEVLGHNRHAERDLTWFQIGLYTGFRISEILRLRRMDVVDHLGTVRTSLSAGAKGSCRSIPLSANARRTISDWLLAMDEQGRVGRKEWLFIGQNGRRLDRKQAWAILRKAVIQAGLSGRIGTHSMRKTFAARVHAYGLNQVMAGRKLDVMRLTSKALGHHSVEDTEAYLSFVESEVDEAILAAQNDANSDT